MKQELDEEFRINSLLKMLEIADDACSEFEEVYTELKEALFLNPDGDKPYKPYSPIGEASFLGLTKTSKEYR
ncbi:hypothetical protein P8917_00965 [Bacillus atrophaeus]|uniref:hypothetical protein n=1 Tax=Bacillus atrophaeus TaxID=1452 RepID=UPI0022832A63|nr:hypothetical protein [Bacillus atrophaeus]MCY8813668.1 hypothetical protein [Bacillus atrophaeus]MCY8820259.1 hypothetical protein [Bacillus atrophaeus]MCY8828617.1 hypothetical protein [Bacillus atrophaeus]MCY8832704.1 hypothetical protein [Bacillus atrophaeus]MEC0749762.1 hypothetical protein [Bacillus atrophaeus]